MSTRSPTTRPIVVSGSDDATVRVWDLDSRELLYEPLKCHKGKVNATTLAVDHQNRLLACPQTMPFTRENSRLDSPFHISRTRRSPA